MGACASKPRDLDSNAEPAPIENPVNSDDKPEAAVTSTGSEDDQKKEKVESKKEEEPLVDLSVPLTHVQQETVSTTTEPLKKEEEEAKATNTNTNTNTNMTNNKPAAPVVAPEAAAATTEKAETVRYPQPVMTDAPAAPKEDAKETAANMTTAPATTTQAQPREAPQSADRKDAPPPLVTL